VSFGTPGGAAWSAYARAGYERASAPIAQTTCLGPDCPPAGDAHWRATYLPISWGVRLSLSPYGRVQPFLEAGSVVSWARFERDYVLVSDYGYQRREVPSSEHWLMGVELGAGVHHATRGPIGFEWGVRYSHLAAPRQSVALDGLHDGGLARVAAVVGIRFRSEPRSQ
jgi:hypothetical protein